MPDDLIGPLGQSPVAPSDPPDARCLVWADVETTGLSGQDALLEIAVVVTDADLNVCGMPVSLVLAASPADLARMDATVRSMHTLSGLLADCARSGTSRRDAQDQIMDYVCAWVPPGTSPLCGSTVHFDRRFITRDLPVFDAFLHYRHIDVSTVKELARRWFPQLYATQTAAAAAHRALPDILDSIIELRFYRHHLFTGATPTSAPDTPSTAGYTG